MKPQSDIEMKLLHSNSPAVVLHLYPPENPIHATETVCAHQGLSLHCLWISVLSPGIKQTQEFGLSAIQVLLEMAKKQQTHTPDRRVESQMLGFCIISSLHPSCLAHTTHLGAPLKDSSPNWLLPVNNLSFKQNFYFSNAFTVSVLPTTTLTD